MMFSCEPAPSPLLSKEGRLRLNRKIPFLSGADGVVNNFKQNKDRCAGIQGGYAISLLTTPSAPLRNGTFLLRAQPPLLKNGGECGRLAISEFAKDINH
jgi:hypothetical protein